MCVQMPLIIYVVLNICPGIYMSRYELQVQVVLNICPGIYMSRYELQVQVLSTDCAHSAVGDRTCKGETQWQHSAMPRCNRSVELRWLAVNCCY